MSFITAEKDNSIADTKRASNNEASNRNETAHILVGKYRSTHNKESSKSTSVLASISPIPLSEVAWPVLIGAVFLLSCFIFQPSTLSFQATLPNPGSTTLMFAA